jgi:hypothetical protein
MTFRRGTNIPVPRMQKQANQRILQEPLQELIQTAPDETHQHQGCRNKQTKESFKNLSKN